MTDKMDYLQWLQKEEFKLENNAPYESDTVVWIRKTKYATPKCALNGDIMIAVTKVGDNFSMSVRAATKDYWANVEAYDLTEETLIKKGRQIEHRLVDAWRELKV